MSTNIQTYEGISDMTDRAVEEELVPGPLRRFVPVVKTVALLVTILGAIPTIITIYHSWQYKIPFSQVSHRLTQYDLWIKNLDCSIEYKALNTAAGTKVDVGACPKTGDISIKITAEDGKATYEWIAYNQLAKPGEKEPASFIDLIIGSANAGGLGKGTKVAQSAMEVMCQSLVSKTELVRVVKEGGKCYRETVSPFRNSVDKREEVSCDTKCTAS